MAKLHSITLPCLILLLIIINQSYSTARILDNSTPTATHHHHHRHHHHNHHKVITFLMRDIFNVTNPSTTKLTTIDDHHLPFSKPLGLFPPSGGVRVPLPAETTPSTVPRSSPQVLDLPGIVGLPFPAAKAALQELEFGIVTSIEEEIYHPYDDLGYGTSPSSTSTSSFSTSTSTSSYGSGQLLGKAKGIYVASSEDGSCHMMAMTASFGNGSGGGGGLRFFGVRRTDVNESHIAIIGGVGKYQGANGYATVKAVDVKSSSVFGEENKGPSNNKLLKFSIYLS